MKAEQEKISAKVRAVSMHLNGGKLQLPAEEESCYVVLVAESGCTLQYAEQTMLLNPGSALLLGPGGGCIQQTGSAAPELVGCSFPLSALHELRTQTQRDFSRLFEPEQSAVLYGSVQWNSRLRTLLELMRTAMEEPDYPGALYLLLVLHYIEQECIAESSAVARPHNKTVERICAYPPEVLPQRGGSAVLSVALLPQPPVQAGDGTVHRGLHQQPPHRGGPEAAGDHGTEHQCGGRADRFCQRGPFPPCVPRGDGHRAAAVPQGT